MANAWFAGDLHLGHSNIGKFRESIGINSPKENEEWLRDFWMKNIKRRDTVYLLGDVAFTRESLDWFKYLPRARIIMTGGNHDELHASEYLEHVNDLVGIKKIWRKQYKSWITHAPIHPDELRGAWNIHGHVHFRPIDDPRYINTSVDYLYATTGKPMMNIHQMRTLMDDRLKGHSIIHRRIK